MLERRHPATWIRAWRLRTGVAVAQRFVVSLNHLGNGTDARARVARGLFEPPRTAEAVAEAEAIL
jgi:hypothetical protein